MESHALANWLVDCLVWAAVAVAWVGVGCAVVDALWWLLQWQYPRLHLLEIHEQQWCPAVVRRYLQDALRFLWRRSLMFRPAADLLYGPVGQQAGRATNIVDLCSGGGGPVGLVAAHLRKKTGEDVRATLTDLFPNVPAWRRVVARHPFVAYEASSVDATAMPPHLARGDVRTMFACFHHFQPALGRKMLADAARNRSSIAVFEFTHVRQRK